MPGLILSPSPLMDADLNVHRQVSKDRSLKYPPGLGMPEASLPTQKNITRRRSGSFTFTSGSNFASGNIFHGGYNTLTRPLHEQPSRLGKRSAITAGFYSPQQRYGGPNRFSSDEPAPPPRSSQSIFFDFSATPSTKFDPFGSDEEPALPMASSTSYSHYWEYDPSINGPKLRSSPPPQKKQLSLLSSPRPRTIQLPPPAPTPTLRKSSSTPSLSTYPSKPRSSPPTSPTYKAPSGLAPLSVPDKNARAKLLANILINRIYAVGKPMRRRLLESDYLNRQYVKSGLSTVISVDC